MKNGGVVLTMSQGRVLTYLQKNIVKDGENERLLRREFG